MSKSEKTRSNPSNWKKFSVLVSNSNRKRSQLKRLSHKCLKNTLQLCLKTWRKRSLIIIHQPLTISTSWLIPDLMKIIHRIKIKILKLKLLSRNLIKHRTRASKWLPKMDIGETWLKSTHFLSKKSQSYSKFRSHRINKWTPQRSLQILSLILEPILRKNK
jgi:hypothetical protein